MIWVLKHFKLVKADKTKHEYTTLQDLYDCLIQDSIYYEIYCCIMYSQTKSATRHGEDLKEKLTGGHLLIYKPVVADLKSCKPDPFPRRAYRFQ